MNARRGFFRLWVVSSGLWVFGASVVAFQAYPTLPPEEAFVMPDATSGFFKLDNIFDQFVPGFTATHYKVEFPNSVTLFVHSSVPEAIVKARSPQFYETYSAPRGNNLSKVRLSFWTTTLLSAFSPPLAILLFGVLFGWIIGGFARDADSP